MPRATWSGHLELPRRAALLLGLPIVHEAGTPLWATGPSTTRALMGSPAGPRYVESAASSSAAASSAVASSADPPPLWKDYKNENPAGYLPAKTAWFARHVKDATSPIIPD